MNIVGRDIDLQRIRKDHKITQQRLAVLTKYPQSFISQVENRRVNVPGAFLKVLMQVLDIQDLEPYYLPTPEEVEAQNMNKALEDKAMGMQATINRLLDLIERQEKRIRELEDQLIHINEAVINKLNQ
ncbi:MAG: helix-turn-helix transcriptional regulator [Muribaculaceae bacterium]|nr:helix-turn-helix transcriptional regulator [Muribaculaceae bacterium]